MSSLILYPAASSSNAFPYPVSEIPLKPSLCTRCPGEKSKYVMSYIENIMGYMKIGKLFLALPNIPVNDRSKLP